MHERQRRLRPRTIDAPGSAQGTAATGTLGVTLALVLCACHGGDPNRGGECAGGIVPGDLVITEIFANPAGTDKGQEWFEIYNARDVPLDVSGLVLRSAKDDGGRTTLTVEFPETLPARIDSLIPSNDTEPDEPGTLFANSQPLAGRHVLVVAPRREVRNTVRESVRSMGLMVDYVTSLEEAAQFCRASMPHAVVYESTLRGERLERLRSEWLEAVPNLAFVQIAEQGKAFELLHEGGRQFASVGRDAIVQQLPAALSFELSRLVGDGS